MCMCVGVFINKYAYVNTTGRKILIHICPWRSKILVSIYVIQIIPLCEKRYVDYKDVKKKKIGKNIITLGYDKPKTYKKTINYVYYAS